MSALLDRIKAADKRAVPVPVPHWGETVYVHRLSLAERLEGVEAVEPLPAAERIAWFVARCVRDEYGAPLFDGGDLAAITALDSVALSEVWRVVKDVNKLFPSADEAAAEKKG